MIVLVSALDTVPQWIIPVIVIVGIFVLVFARWFFVFIYN